MEIKKLDDESVEVTTEIKERFFKSDLEKRKENLLKKLAEIDEMLSAMK